MDSVEGMKPQATATQGIAVQRGIRATWLYTYGSVVFVAVTSLGMVVVYAFAAEAPSWIRLTLVISSVVLGISLCWLLTRFKAGAWQGFPPFRAGEGEPFTTGLVAATWATALIMWVATLWQPELVAMGSVPLQMVLWTWMMFDPTRTWRPWTFGVIAAAVLHALVSSWLYGASSLTAGAKPAVILFVMAFFPITLILSLWFWDIMRQLEKARHIEGELAVTRERLRFAADLHDIQGHHLQVIALKTELAERTLEKNPHVAMTNLREAREQAKLAMEETRALVHGYREVTLEQELRNAAQVLTSAGVDCSVELPADGSAFGSFSTEYDGAASVPATSHRLLGHVVREGTTNILRHSSATKASIRMVVSGGVVRLEIRNNNPAEAPAAAQVSAHSGNGIAGLRERVVAAGGQLEAGQQADEFVMSVAVPQEVSA